MTIEIGTATEIQRSCTLSSVGRISNDEIKQSMGIETTIIDAIVKKQLSNVRRQMALKITVIPISYKARKPRMRWKEKIKKAMHGSI